MLVGSYRNTLDTNGRVFFPATFRPSFGETVIIAEGAKACLVVYTEEAFAEFVERLRRNGQTGAKDPLRYISYHSANVELDGQGRILIPAELRTYAQLDKEVLFVGMMDTVEIWNEKNVIETVSTESAEAIDDYLIKNGL